MDLTLHDVVQAYIADSDFQMKREVLRKKRDDSIPPLQGVIQRFIQGEINLQIFRSQLDKTLHSTDDWGALGFGFMMELNKLGKYHDEHGNLAENELREVLTGLQASNLGDHIERFYTFLLAERERLRHEGKTSGMVVAARNSAYIVSLFACWLDLEGQPIIYYDSLRKGLFTLIKAGLLSATPQLHLGPNAIEVQSAVDHNACLVLINDLASHEPTLPVHRYWIEYFSYWVMQNVQLLTEPSNTLVKDTDADNILIHASGAVNVTSTTTSVNEQIPEYKLSSTATQTRGEAETETALLIKAEPLRPTPEPLLTRLIHEVQRSILIDESVIRRIYHALLAGHVILTGPPGTGKTELARIIPEILWRSEKKAEPEEIADETENSFDTLTAYTTRLVTATDEWSVRTLISGIAPQNINGTITYAMQYGFLTDTIQKNWSSNGSRPEEWNRLRRKMITAQSALQRGTAQTFRGQWLVIDEFNRAPIDVAFGDALTAIGGNEVLRVSIEGGSAELPIPQDFRIIGTLNSFDRNYLNQISEALKRRFSFVEILPPTRQHRQAEQSIVLYKALKGISHLSNEIEINDDGTVYWGNAAMIAPDESGTYLVEWEHAQHPFRTAFEQAWRLFEVIRIYRQLGTAQAISMLRHMLIAGILQAYATREAWFEQAFDDALCDTIADQLQVLMPDEIDVLLSYLTIERVTFADTFHDILRRLASSRISAQLLAFGGVINDQGQSFLSDEQIEHIATADTPQVPASIFNELFHLDSPHMRLPQFTRRLRVFKSERGL